MGVQNELVRDHFHQFLFNGKHGLAWCKPRAVRHSIDVRVNRHGGLAKRRVQNDVGCFSANARKRFERLTCLWDLAIMFFNQDFAGFYDVLGFAVKEADRFDVALQAAQPQF